MTFVATDPLRSLVRLQSEMSRMMRDAFEDVDAANTAFVPPVDIIERNDEVVLIADLPGVRRDDLEVSVENRTLTLSGARHEPSEYKESNIYRTERPAGRFTRTFALPATVDVNRITADHKDGVLRVALPKAAEARPRRIEIRNT